MACLKALRSVVAFRQVSANFINAATPSLKQVMPTTARIGERARVF
jgi:hypothetical protein